MIAKQKGKKIIAIVSAFVLCVTSIGLWYQPWNVEAADIVPVYLQGFQNITTSSFVDNNGKQMEDHADYTQSSSLYHLQNMQGNEIESFDKTLLSLNVKFTKAIASSFSYTRLEIAGYENSSGLRIWTSEDGTELYFNNTDSGKKVAENIYKVFSAETAGVKSFLNDEFLLQISFEYGDYDEGGTENDIRLRFYFDGVLYEEAYHTLYNYNADKIGNCLRVFGYSISDKPTTVSSAVPAKDNLTQISWSDFQDAITGTMTSSKTYSVMEDAHDIAVYRLNSEANISQMSATHFTAKLTFEKGSQEDCIYYGGTYDRYGFAVYVNEEGNLCLHTKETYGPNLGENENLGAVIFDKDIAGVETFLNQEFTIGITTEFADFDEDGVEDDVQLGFYFNETLYNGQYLYAFDCREDFGNYITVHPGSGSIRVRLLDDNTVSPVYIPGFQNITTSSFVNSSENQMADHCRYTSSSELYSMQNMQGGEVDGFNKTLLSLNVKFEAGTTNARIEFGGTKVNSGFRLVVSEDGTELQFNNTNSSDKVASNAFRRFYATTAGVKSFLNQEFLLQISFEYGDFNDDEVENDLRLGFYFDGVLYDGEPIVIADCDMTKVGNCIRIYCDQNNGGLPITVSSVVPERADLSEVTWADYRNTSNGALAVSKKQEAPLALDGFSLVTTNDFVNSAGTTMADTGAYGKSASGTNSNRFQLYGADNLDEKLMTLRVKFESTTGSRIEFGVPDNNGTTGAFRIFPNNETTLVLNRLNKDIVTADSVYTSFSATDYGLTSWVGTEFLLQIAVEHIDSNGDETDDAVKLTIYINGKTAVENKTITAISDISQVGSWINVYNESTESPITVSAANLKAYVLENEDISHMEGTDWQTKMTFHEEGPTNGVFLGGTEATSGLYVSVLDDKLTLTSTKKGPNINLSDGQLIFEPTIAGVNADTFLNKEFTFGITTEFADYDGDGDANDVQIGFYFNGTLYNNQYLYEFDCQELIGNYITISGIITMKSSVKQPEIVFCHLPDGAYSLYEEQLWMNGEKVSDAEINKAGDYWIAAGSEDNVLKYVVAYSVGDANADNSIDIKDLIASKKVELSKSAESKAKFCGADMDEDHYVNSDDLNALRNELLEDITDSYMLDVATSGGYIYDTQALIW